MDEFNPGDRFIRRRSQNWNDGELEFGVVYESTSGMARYKCRECGNTGRDHYAAVRFDDHDYMLDRHPGNHHTLAKCLMEHKVTDEDIEAAIASIKKAASS